MTSGKTTPGWPRWRRIRNEPCVRHTAQSPYLHCGFHRVWLKHNLNFKGWNSQAHRQFPGEFESSNVSRGNVSREIGRSAVWTAAWTIISYHIRYNNEIANNTNITTNTNIYYSIILALVCPRLFRRNTVNLMMSRYKSCQHNCIHISITPMCFV